MWGFGLFFSLIWDKEVLLLLLFACLSVSYLWARDFYNVNQIWFVSRIIFHGSARLSSLCKNQIFCFDLNLLTVIQNIKINLPKQYLLHSNLYLWIHFHINKNYPLNDLFNNMLVCWETMKHSILKGLYNSICFPNKFNENSFPSL